MLLCIHGPASLPTSQGPAAACAPRRVAAPHPFPVRGLVEHATSLPADVFLSLSRKYRVLSAVGVVEEALDRTDGERAAVVIARPTQTPTRPASMACRHGLAGQTSRQPRGAGVRHAPLLRRLRDEKRPG